MRNFAINLLLAFCIFQLWNYIQTHTSTDYFLMQEVMEFNEDVQNHQILQDYHESVVIEPNKTACAVEKISNYSREIITVAVDVLLSITNGFN